MTNDKELFRTLVDAEDVRAFKPNAAGMLALKLRFNLDDLESVADDALVDDKLDHKCDILYIDRERNLAVVCQAYEADSLDKPNPPANKAADLNTAMSWILDGSVPNSELGEKLQSAAAGLRDALQSGEISVLEIWFSHNLPHNADVDKELRQVEKTAAGIVKSNFPNTEGLDVRCLQVSRDRMISWYKNQNTAILVADTIAVPLVGGFFTQEGEGWRAVCTSVPATWLKELYVQHGDELFSANVRGPIPSRKSANNINYNIGETAKDDPTRFWAYNNGITAIVGNIKVSDDHASELEVSGLAIVNGAQTTGSLARETGGDLSQVRILARFVESSDASVIDDIIRFNNSQNPIRSSDFRSRDSHQTRLRKEFRSIPDVTYLGARRGGANDTRRKPANHISADTAAQALASFHGDANTAYHDLKNIWEHDETYLKYFSDHTSATHIVFCWSLLRSIQEKKQELSGMANLTVSDQECLSFLRKRGATFALVSAIAATCESILSRPLSDTFRLSFGPSTSPDRAVRIWDPVVASLYTFAPLLDEPGSATAFQRYTDLSPRITNFARSVASVRAPHQKTFADFASHVYEDASPEVE